MGSIRSPSALVDELDIVCSSISPDEAEPPLRDQCACRNCSDQMRSVSLSRSDLISNSAHDGVRQQR